MEREPPIGELWERKTKAGDYFLSGEIVIHGETHKIVAFRNKYTTVSSADYSIFKSKFERKNRKKEPKHNISETDILIKESRKIKSQKQN